MKTATTASTTSRRPPTNPRRTALLQPQPQPQPQPQQVRSRLLSAPSSADPPKKPRRTTITIRRRAASGSALNRVTAPVKNRPIV
ncbi:hypothetical protein KIN20_037441 [Parelaphostrongylus tenuis]|uniref:Uncharacterized protein n=1 Tax=Parelaphostrongylus tenuis TaxID=148309 RepID=A0AAD5RE91_PARTN|nr:hypothetical protein KIN20_037441 [Parelaphostrongylus tenuis]